MNDSKSKNRDKGLKARAQEQEEGKKKLEQLEGELLLESTKASGFFIYFSAVQYRNLACEVYKSFEMSQVQITFLEMSGDKT